MKIVITILETAGISAAPSVKLQFGDEQDILLTGKEETRLRSAFNISRTVRPAGMKTVISLEDGSFQVR